VNTSLSFVISDTGQAFPPFLSKLAFQNPGAQPSVPDIGVGVGVAVGIGVGVAVAVGAGVGVGVAVGVGVGAFPRNEHGVTIVTSIPHTLHHAPGANSSY